MEYKGKVDYIAIKPRKSLWVALIICLTLISVIGIAVVVKLFVEMTSLVYENESLKGIIEMKNSQIADLEENCEMLYNQLRTSDKKE